MKKYDFKIYLRGVSEPLFYEFGSDEVGRWLDSHNPEQNPRRGFGEYRTVDHHHLFINSDHVLVAQILDDAPGADDNLPDNYDAPYEARPQPDPDTGEYSPETWRFKFWVHGIPDVFDISDLDEHDFITISCGLLNYESDGKFFITLTDEDGEQISFRAADIMLADGFDYLNETEKT